MCKRGRRRALFGDLSGAYREIRTRWRRTESGANPSLSTVNRLTPKRWLTNKPKEITLFYTGQQGAWLMCQAFDAKGRLRCPSVHVHLSSLGPGCLEQIGSATRNGLDPTAAPDYAPYGNGPILGFRRIDLFRVLCIVTPYDHRSVQSILNAANHRMSA